MMDLPADHIRFLGTHGSAMAELKSTCIQVNSQVLIDAGSILSSLGKGSCNINKIFLTHSHWDHIADLGFFIDYVYASRKEPIFVYALPETISALKKHIFNNEIWPDFTKINLPHSERPTLEFLPLELNHCYRLDDYISLRPFHSEHTVATCGFYIRYGDSTCLFSSDNFLNDLFWQRVNDDLNITSIVVDVSFPNELEHLAISSQHMTPKLLAQGLERLQRSVKVYIHHIKPSYKQQVMLQLQEIGIDQAYVLQELDQISLTSGQISR